MHQPTISSGAVVAAALLLLAALPGAQAGLYTKKSPVLQVDAKNYDSLIAKSNYTSIVEFYAPWCGHCQNLKPAYEKAATNLAGLAKVAAVNCDEDTNKAFCGSMGVQGFPTLKIVKPRKDGKGKPVIEDYNGQRAAGDITDAVVRAINNHVKKVEDKSVEDFLKTKNESAKAILFTDKGTTSALLKSVAIDFLGTLTVGQVRNKEAKTVGMFGVSKFPTLVLLPGGDKPAIVYDGELKKVAIVTFLSQVGAPNPDPAPTPDKKAKPAKPSSKPSTSTTTTSAAEKKETTATQEAPVIVGAETALPIPAIHSADKLIKHCLTDKSHTCVLAFVPSYSSAPTDPQDATQEVLSAPARDALTALADISHKYKAGNRHMFPFFEVPHGPASESLLKALELTGDVEIIAINARRGWWRRYEGEGFGHEGVEAWIDQIRLSEGVKRKLPEGVVAISVESSSASAAAPEEAAGETSTVASTESATMMASSEETTTVTAEASAEATKEGEKKEATEATEPTPEKETARVHEEL